MIRVLIANVWPGFNEFISDRERVNPKSKDPRMVLFDEIILAKRNRGRTSIFSGRNTTEFLSDTSEHLWRTASASFLPNSRSQRNPSGDYTHIVTRGESSFCLVCLLQIPIVYESQLTFKPLVQHRLN